MIIASRHVKAWVLLALVCSGLGCAAQPKLKADAVGLADLPFGPAAPSPHASALELPKLVRAGDTADDRRALRAVERPAYRVGPGDELVVIVWGRPDLGSLIPAGSSADLRASVVQHDGGISLPFLGAVEVGGLTVPEVQDLIVRRYAEIIERPQVEVKLLTCRSRTVAFGGAVGRPGPRHVCFEQQTLGELLADAGGLSSTADERHGVLTRQGVSYHLDHLEVRKGLSRAADILLQDGDAVYFPSVGERVVHIFGEVRRQGSQPIPPQGMTILEALSQAQGVDTITSDTNRVFLVRHTSRGVATYRMTLAELMTGPAIQVNPGDTLYIPTNKLAKWDRWWRKALPFANVQTEVVVGDDN